MFPRKVLDDFRKHIRDATSKNKERFTHKRSNSNDSNCGEKSTISIKADEITKKLYRRPTPLKGERDYYGVRCSMHEKDFEEIIKIPYSNSSVSRNKSNEKLYITASQRINLGRPINFNPGPGAYLKETTTPVGKRSLGSSIHLS